MQKSFIGIIFTFMPALALANLPPLTQDPTTNVVSSMNASPATQSYHSVDDPAPVQPSSAAQSNSTVKKKKIIATSKPAVEQKQATQLLGQLQSLEGRLTQFTQSYLLAQQESKQELALLEQKAATLQAEVEQLMTVIKTLNQQVAQLKTQSMTHENLLNELSKGFSLGALSSKLNSFSGSTNNTLLLALLVLLMVWLLARLRIKHKKTDSVQQQARDEDDTKNEYDFMGSSEGVPAQLDLARAYIAMENYVGAENVLQQVLAKGDATQQQQARELLAQIPKK